MKEKSNVKIFISYRRQGGIDTARWLHDQLRDRGYNVFLDMEGLRSGAFNQALYHEIKSRDVFLMVLNKDCLNRCRSKNDWVRQELSYAFRCGSNVIPVMKEDFEFPNRLPSDISPIRSCNGLRISYQFFDAFMNTLEEYILAEPENRGVFIPEPEPTVNWVKYAAAGAAAVALLAGALLLGKSCDNAPAPAETTAPISTTAPEATAPPVTEDPKLTAAQELGNSTGNQCNSGVAAINQYAYYKNSCYLNTLQDTRYHVGSKDRTVYFRSGNTNSVPIMTGTNVDFLLVTTDWFYYTIADGETAKLYRAPRPEGSNSVTGSEELASGFLAENNIMIDGEFAYYWRYNKGLYRLDLVTKEESLLLELDATWTADTIGKTGNWVYLFTDDSISRVHAEDSRYETVFKLEEHFSDAKLAAANATDGWIYFCVTDSGEDAYHHYDRVYRMHTDGSELERIFAADTSICRVKRICVTDYNVHLDMECGKDGRCHYYLSQNDWTIMGSDTVHAEDHEETACVTVGNTISNLCNQAAAAPKDGDTTTYKTSNASILFNLFSDADISYSYNKTTLDIQVSWKENGESKNANLLEDVTCHYLYVTPDWLYFVLEEGGVSNLYRAQNNMEVHTIGEKQLVAENIYHFNNVAIRNGSIYYWKSPDGLYRSRTDGTDAQVIYSNNGKGIGTWPTVHVSADILYFWSPGGGIYTVSLADNSMTHAYSTKEQPGSIAHMVEAGGRFYYVVQHISDGARTAPDEIWSVNSDGTDAKPVLTCSDSMSIEMLNASNKTLFLKIQEGDTMKLYKITTSGELTEVYTYE